MTTPLAPVAIIGMSCRFAGGVDSPAQFWSMLSEGRDAVGDLPEGRWDWYAGRSREHAAALRGATRRGAFLDDIAGFDADFFDITPREAALMDPQQRIVLELAWEALENAGVPPQRLAGTDTGVFMGVGADDYGRRLLEDLPRIEAWTGIGGAYCAVANRVSHVLDLRGPSVAVDTACSSSLVAIHLAAQALRAGECPVAIAGGVLVVAAPGLSMVLDAAGATSPDGRSKSFDAVADGYGRGEGGGVVVLKLLTDAVRDGDRILAVLRGSAVRQDGRTNGIMAPNGQAQAHLMRQAYRSCGVDPATVGFVEAHGTGTRVGDPLEAAATGEVLGAGRAPDRPCLIGSVKPNIGHLEAGAGVAGVIKAVLALRHGQVPPTLGVAGPSPAIAWQDLGLRLVTEPMPFPDLDGPRRAAVSGYGYGGTIAHLILEQAPEEVPPGAESTGAAPTGTAVYPLSGASRAAVRRYAERLADHLSDHPQLRTADVGHTLARHRARLPYRAAVLAADRGQLVANLRAVADADAGPDIAGPVPPDGHPVVWVFSGHGSQWVGMARELLAGDPAFAEVVDRLEPVIRAEAGFSPRAALRDDTPAPVDVVQIMIFVVQVALAAVWRRYGVTPAAVVGHSVGEIAAAVTAGVFTVEQGARLVCRRSVLLRRVAGRGAMAMVHLPADQVRHRLAGRTDVALAVASSPGTAVISGDAAAVDELTGRWQADGIVVRPVRSDTAFHSPHMDGLADELARAVADLTPAPPRIPLYSSALPDPRSDAPRDGAYWARNLRGQVRFDTAVAAAAQDGYRLFLEVSPHPVVEHSITEIVEQLAVADSFVAHSLRRHRPERDTLLASLAQLYHHGAELDWSGHFVGGRLADLPTTVWQRRPHWAPEPPSGVSFTAAPDDAGHTLLGERVTVHGTPPADVWLARVDRDSRPYPGDHPVRDVEITPAAVLLQTFRTAAAATGAPADLADVHLRVPVSLTQPREVQVLVQDGSVRLSSRIVDGGTTDRGWVTHTTARFDTAGPLTLPPELPPAATTALAPTYVVERLATLGVAAMGFPWSVQRIWRSADGLDATVDTGPDATGWAPLLDAVLSVASVAFDGPPVLRMPAHIGAVVLAERPPATARVRVRVTAEDTVDVEIRDVTGDAVGRFSGLRYGVLDRDDDTVVNPRRLVHQVAWRPLDLPEIDSKPEITLVGADQSLLRALSRRLTADGVAHRAVVTPDDLRDADLDGDHAVVLVPALGSATRVGADAADTSWLLARTARRIATARRATPARLWCVTRGVRDGTDPRALAHAPLWGLGRIIGGEHPELWGGVIDTDGSERDIATVLSIVRGTRREDVIAVRDGQPFVPRLRTLDGSPRRPSTGCRPDGTYLVTGGLGALGLEVARWLAGRGARRLVLLGRRALPPRSTWDDPGQTGVGAATDAIRALERRGVTVVPVAVDVADPAEVARRLAPDVLGLPPVRGVVHAAGVLDNRMLQELTEESLHAVLRPKVAGALVLHDLFPPGSLDFFVLFSSSGQLLGLPGQASYAAGNAFLDALAAHRRAVGDTATTSLGWTSWRGLGMSTSSAVTDIELAARGVGDVNPVEAFEAWDLADRHDLTHAAVLRTVAPEPGERRLPLLEELTGPAPTAAADPVPGAQPWAGLHGGELHARLVAEISRQVADETQLVADELDPHRPLIEMGLDSVMTVRIRRGLERRLRLPLPATLFWDHPTIDAVASLLAEVVSGETVPC